MASVPRKGEEENKHGLFSYSTPKAWKTDAHIYPLQNHFRPIRICDRLLHSINRGESISWFMFDSGVHGASARVTQQESS